LSTAQFIQHNERDLSAHAHPECQRLFSTVLVSLLPSDEALTSASPIIHITTAIQTLANRSWQVSPISDCQASPRFSRASRKRAGAMHLMPPEPDLPLDSSRDLDGA